MWRFKSIFKAFFVVIFSLTIHQGYGQQDELLNQRFSLQLQSEMIEEAISKLERLIGINISYSSSLVDPSIKITRNFRNQPLRILLDTIFEAYDISYIQSGDIILIKIIRLKKKKSQLGEIRGKVTDQSDSPMPFATVAIKGTQKGVLTDEKGRFSISNIPEGVKVIRFSFTGFAPREESIQISPNKISEINIQLEEMTNELEQVTVIGNTIKTKLEKTALSIKVIDLKEAKLQTADLGEVLARSEGVNVRRGGSLGSSTLIALNGFQGSQIRIFYDDVPLSFYGVPSQGVGNIPLNLIDRVEIFKGVVPIRFGADALGGAINIVSPQQISETAGSFSYQIGSFGTHRFSYSANLTAQEKQLYLRSSGFYDIAENDYKVEVRAVNDRGRIFETEVKRFHDGYEAKGINLELGVMNKSWADKASISAFFNQFDKDIQHNVIMAVPFGEAVTGNSTYGTLVKWEKKISDKVNLDLVGGYRYSKSYFRDTSRFIYNWFGELVREPDGSPRLREGNQRELGNASDQFVTDDAFYIRFNGSSDLNPNHKLTWNVSPTYTVRSGKEQIDIPANDDPFAGGKRRLFGVNAGLEHEWSNPNKKLESLVFGKVYGLDLSSRNIGPTGIPLSQDRRIINFGGGNSFIYRLNTRSSVKGAYEYTIRMPNAGELFGDGRLIFGNISLRPEKSHNANVEYIYKQDRPGRQNWSVTLGGFYRSADDLIQLFPLGDRAIHRNITSVISQGVEISVARVSSNNRLRMVLNGTWQDLRNRSTSGTFEASEGERLPNRPYLFSNLSSSYLFPRVFKTNDNLSVFLNGRYVHEFLRTWELDNIAQSFVREIPAQLFFNTGTTYKRLINKQQFVLTAEIQNITNAKIFDFFGVQKPGRTFFLKVTTQF